VSRRALIVSASFALAIALGSAALRGGVGAASPAEGYRIWSDAFFGAAVFVGGSGILAFASADGLFDVIRYGVGKALRVVLSKEKRDAYPRTFYDYRMQKRGGGMGGLSAMLMGVVCLALGGAFLWLYMGVMP
jgi:hypothetical protein